MANFVHVGAIFPLLCALYMTFNVPNDTLKDIGFMMSHMKWRLISFDAVLCIDTKLSII